LRNIGFDPNKYRKWTQSKVALKAEIRFSIELEFLRRGGLHFLKAFPALFGGLRFSSVLSDFEVTD